MFSAFRMGPAARISIEYYSELLNHMSENWEVVARRKYTDYNENRKVIGIFFSRRDFPIFDT